LTYAAYNGGWDAGEKPAQMTSEALFRSLNFWNYTEKGTEESLFLTRRFFSDAPYKAIKVGTYEAGPGYALSGLNQQKKMSEEQVEAQDQVGKSQATAVATLDAFLGQASLGYAIQNFFTFSFNRRYWSSHASISNGGHAFPSWKLLSLFNTQGTGDFLEVQTLAAPSYDLPEYTRRGARTDAPLVAVYATRDKKRLNLFVLSRKIDRFVEPGDDGYTPVSIKLPFRNAAKVTLYKMADDPRRHNLDQDLVKIKQKTNIPFSSPFKLTSEVTGMPKDGLPPGSAFLFVFEGTDIFLH
jgi:hypothetical protein